MRRPIVALLVTACALAPLAATAAVPSRSGSTTEVRTASKAGAPQRVVKKRTARRPAQKATAVKAAKKAPAKRAGAGADIRV